MTDASHYPTTRERADSISDLTDEQLFGLFCQKLTLCEDPNNNRLVVRETENMSPEEKRQRVDLVKHLADVMVEHRPDLIPRVADAMRMAVQMAPDFLAAARNEVRRNFEKPPMVEPDFVNGAFAVTGKVTAQNERQTIVTDVLGRSQFLLDNSLLSEVPKRDASVRIERAGDEGKFKVEVLALGKERANSAGLAR
jgi:hypothetical protein